MNHGNTEDLDGREITRGPFFTCVNWTTQKNQVEEEALTAGVR